MPLRLSDYTDKELLDRGYSPKLREGFIEVPLPEEIAPTEHERYLLDGLTRWMELSKRSQVQLGVPYNLQVR